MALDKNINCKHSNIILVTEKPRDNKGKIQVNNTFVECEDCGTILPIQRVTIEERIVPIFQFKN